MRSVSTGCCRLISGERELLLLDTSATVSQEVIMPLPSDEKIVALAEDLLKQFDAIFGLHPGFRPAHAKGSMLTGTFTPAPGADAFTRAAHVTRDSTPVTVRFSNSTGLPLIPDNDPNANPRGCAIRLSSGRPARV